MLVDDGVKNRGHRMRIFNSDYTVAGISCGEHSKLGSMCVITFAAGFAEKQAGSAASPARRAHGSGVNKF
ncbi:MAG TPA: hypothetical protein VF754_10570 [Pyrinomonadaceae bacterium]